MDCYTCRDLPNFQYLYGLPGCVKQILKTGDRLPNSSWWKGKFFHRLLCVFSGRRHIGSTATKPGAAAHKTAQNKIDKYSKLASTHIFYPFAIETAGTWHEMATELTRDLQAYHHYHRRHPGDNFFFQRLSMALQRGNAVSFHNTMVTE